ncbi:DUF4386 domain-containing protein [Thalassobacillus hwangdonensis]|uniref:DUF4386 domain-containing protein n=1 Tax=Thalassobacillus hwangdonensis TaxID=546108 RepID=A0ABW3L533_9BACI
MTTTITFGSAQRKAAIIAGVSLIIMTLAAMFSYGYVHSSLIVEGDAGATFENLQASLPLFHFGILGWMVIILTDIVVSWAFYIVLKPVHAGYSLLVGWLRILYTAILATAVAQLVIASKTIQAPETSASQVMQSVIGFEAIWSIGLIVFGVHLMLAGYVAIKSITIPKVISILLMVAGGCYALIHSMYNFFPSIENLTGTLESILSLPMMAGESGFGIWLLFKGIKAKTVTRRSLKGAS